MVLPSSLCYNRIQMSMDMSEGVELMEYNPFQKIATNKKTQADQLADNLRQMIITKQLNPEKAFPNENEMCVLLNVSRSTLREAYKILEIQGYISRTKHGTYVKEMDEVAMSGSFNASLELSKYNDLIEFLLILETEAVHLAASRATDEELAEIEAIMHECEENCHIPGAIETLNYQFHLKIRVAAKNKLIVSALSATYDQFNQKIIHKLIVNDEDGFMEQCLEDHRNLFQAIKEKNADKAKEIAKEHLLRDVELYQKM